MLTLKIESEMQDPDDENLYITKQGKLTFVDLAGQCERSGFSVVDHIWHFSQLLIHSPNKTQQKKEVHVLYVQETSR